MKRIEAANDNSYKTNTNSKIIKVGSIRYDLYPPKRIIHPVPQKLPNWDKEVNPGIVAHEVIIM